MKLKTPLSHSLPIALIATLLAPPSRLVAQNSESPSEDQNPIVATADGIEIRKKVMDLGVLSARATYIQQGIAPESINEAKVQDIVLRNIAAEHLLRKRATEKQISETLEKVPEIVAKQIEGYGSETAFDAVLKNLGIDREFFVNGVERQAIADRVLNDLKIQADGNIDEEDAKEYYDEHPELFEYPASYRAAHILWETIDPVTGGSIASSEAEEKRQEAEKVAELAKQEDADFKALVREYSDDIRSKDRGGEYTFLAGQMDPMFERAALGLEPGEVSDLVETNFGYHVIKLIRIQPKRMESFEKVKDDIIERLKSEGERQAREGIVDRILEEGNFRNLLAEEEAENSN